MPVSGEELANRLKVARENAGLTQQQVAEAIGIPRTAIVQIEAAKRVVNSLELSRLALLLGRGIGELVGESPFREDPVGALLRAAPGFSQPPQLEADLRRFANLAREATNLEELLGLKTSRPAIVRYELDPPSARWEAVRQGKMLAIEERKRLGLGDSPVWEITEIVRGQGVRATEADMPADISGLFFHRPDTGAVIVVDRHDVLARRLFSYAHEYCHCLADRDRAGTVSRRGSDELIEVRANAFAAHFLMPEGGVRSFLRTVSGKGEPTRQNQEIFGGENAVAVQQRAQPASQDLQIHDIVRLAHHFGVSYDAALFHLLNLNLLTRERFDLLRAQSATAKSVRRALQIPEIDGDAHWTLAEQVLGLALEAHRRSLISRRKVVELAAEAGVVRKVIEEAMMEEGTEEEPVEPVFPE